MHATSLLSSGEVLRIERHGKPVGIYVPIEAKDRGASRVTVAEFDEFMEQLLERLEMTEDEFVEEILRKPFPRDPRP